jgi:S1-C subfamily serine protease
MGSMAVGKKTLYDILVVTREANDIDIGLAYQKRTAELERASPPQPGAQSLLHEAYEVLHDPARRAAYDAALVSAAEKAQAAQQAEPDLVLEGDAKADEEARRGKLVVGAIAAVAVIAVVAVVAMRGKSAPPPAPEPVAEAPKPAAPPPPKPKSAVEVLADAITSSCKLLSYDMSGSAVTLGIAAATEPGAMVTTCHGIPAGAKLVVRVGNESFPADLAITDEVLDLCRLSVAGFTTRPLAIAAEDAKAGDAILVAGINKDGEMAMTEGTVKEIRTMPGGKVMELSMPVAPLGSGGPVFDRFGKLVGIATTPHRFGAGLNIALPASWLAQMRSRDRASP